MNELGEANAKYFGFAEIQKIGLEQINPGSIITGVPPKKLYTLQLWISTIKVMNALRRRVEQNEHQTTGYVHRGKDGRVRLILGDGNTRAIVALVRGQKVQFEVKGLLPPKSRYIPLYRLYQDFSDLFVGF